MLHWLGASAAGKVVVGASVAGLGVVVASVSGAAVVVASVAGSSGLASVVATCSSCTISLGSTPAACEDPQPMVLTTPVCVATLS